MAVPVLSFPPELPVSACRDEIAQAISAHQVVVIAGETGSGKTTQLPKICLQLGRDSIAHTQPRRLAATSVARRIADETRTELGDLVGYSVRFSDKTSKATKVKVMTDGILLREITSDPQLRRYDTIIIDEAHERSLNIDFLLGYLKRLLPRRPDLKVIITSATIEQDRFARHFATADDQVPMLEVSGRTYPVQIRYRPLETDDPEQADLDQIAAIDAAVGELWSAQRGDILVFLPTERDIRETADALKHRRDAQIVPLYARLSVAEQQKIFTPSNGRRIVLSTNVAETSLTVPGIRYVIDTGTARISRYSSRTKVTRLPIEKVSQASARQRAGRCGRVAPGICIRLYSEDDFDTRPEYTDPEILRANLAAVILSMLSLRLGDVADFPFVQPPSPRAINGGMALLSELGAVTELDSAQAQLTKVGRDLARLPIDPRLARMLIAAHENGCLDHVLVIAAALALPDVREFPADRREAAQAAHRQYAVAGSEFLSRLRLWEHLQEQREALSGNQFRRQCERGFLHYLRIREWFDLHRQLRRTVRELGWEVPRTQVDAAAIHRSLLTGLLTNIGVKFGDGRDYLGTRGTKFTLFPGSQLAGKPPAFVMAAELMETSRLFAHTVASIDPEWVEQIAPQLVTRTYSEPAWSSRRGAVMADEKVSLYGVPLVAARRVNYGRIDPAESRAIFLQAALVEGRWRTRHEFYAHNQRLLSEAEDLEHRSRRVVRRSDADVYDFYDARIPANVVSARHFDSWWKKESRKNPRLLHLDEAGPAATGVPAAADYPAAWQQGQTRLELRYHFAPGEPDDGVTVVIPQPLLAHVQAAGFDWLVPGLRVELATAVIRSLPKGLRKSLSPASQYAELALSALQARSEPFVPALARELGVITGISLSPADFRIDTLPTHLRMHYAVADEQGVIIGTSDDLDELRRQFTARRPAPPTAPVYRAWSDDGIGVLADRLDTVVSGQPVVTYPTLEPAGDGVRVTAVTSPAARDAGLHAGVQILLEQTITPLTKKIANGLPPAQRLSLSQCPYADPARMFADCTRRAIADALGAESDVAALRTPQEFNALAQRLSPQVRAAAPEYFTHTVSVLAEVFELRRAIDAHSGSAAADDVAEQLAHLVFDGFIAETPLSHLRHVPRYLTAARVRLEALPGSAARDGAGLDTVDRVIAHWNQRLAQVPESRQEPLNDLAHWMLEELRVSLFAQQLGTAGPVSEKRLIKALDSFR
ncbi:ATP-dependent RNA helicase HrpA [Gordonia hirsuta DSM 44140 = NBRC 16056]|uniref:ATP-dependent RNA helicase HrpA n=1 Tax=Gordonia hirsuta DSM 44140 = NBRC 16056 TaxID=1121927 RepID=L7LE22_9ACTN|nr:ATP-dependent RNA helicase HrpA [Gordonia hirsuta]GAC58322.1 ATP-dependent RNA helicase HrpA [Gordonia hirsuta DSM 44140 = NBRC 16056]